MSEKYDNFIPEITNAMKKKFETVYFQENIL